MHARSSTTTLQTAQIMQEGITLVKLQQLSRRSVKDVAMYITDNSAVWSDALVQIAEEAHSAKASSFRRCLLFLLYEMWVLVQHDKAKCVELIGLIHWVGPIAVASLSQSDAAIVNKIVLKWQGGSVVSPELVACWTTGARLSPMPQGERLPILLDAVRAIHELDRAQPWYQEATRWRAAQLLHIAEQSPHIFEQHVDSTAIIALAYLATKVEGQRIPLDIVIKKITGHVFAPRRIVPSAHAHSMTSVVRVERALLPWIDFNCPASPMEVFHQLFPLNLSQQACGDQPVLTSHAAVLDAARHWCPQAVHEQHARRLLAQSQCLAMSELFSFDSHILAAAATLLAIAQDGGRGERPSIQHSPSSISAPVTPIEAYITEGGSWNATCCAKHTTLKRATGAMLPDAATLTSAIDKGLLRAVEMLASHVDGMQPAAQAIETAIRRLQGGKRSRCHSKHKNTEKCARTSKHNPPDVAFRRKNVTGPDGTFEPYKDGRHRIRGVIRLSEFVSHGSRFSYRSSKSYRLKSEIYVVAPGEEQGERRVRPRLISSEA